MLVSLCEAIWHESFKALRALLGEDSPTFERKECRMSVAKVSEISATSTTSFEDAIQQGLKRAHKTLRGMKSAWIKEQQVRLEKGRITEYQVNMMVTFVLDD
jgi:flavin-binding protein dodecin